MIITLIICILFSIKINAEIITTFSPFNMTEELAEIERACLSEKEHDELSGNKYKKGWAREFNIFLIYPALDIIGNLEMRNALGFSQYSGSFQNHKYPTEEELKAALSLEKYFELQTLCRISLKTEHHSITDKELATAIPFLDKKLPGIRMIFRRKIEEFLKTNKAEKIDRQIIYELIEKTYEISDRVESAIHNMYHSRKCQTYPRPDDSLFYSKTVRECVTNQRHVDS